MLPRLRLWLGKIAHTDLAFLAGAGIVCACLSLFIALANVVRAGEFQPLEERILRALRSPDDPRLPRGPAWLEGVARDISALGGTTVLTLVTVTAVSYLILQGRRRPALFVGVSVIGGTALSSGLKAFFERARPDAWLHLTPVHSPSFPSGHSMLSSVVYLTLGVMLSRLVSRRSPKLFCIFVALTLSFLVGLSRIFLGVHYPTDVLSGWTAGIAWSLVCAMVFARRTVPDR
jgi:undecaprenyl-diphosphatase